MSTRYIGESNLQRLWHDRYLMRKVRKGTREFHYYYCDWWCFLTNMKRCKK